MIKKFFPNFKFTRKNTCFLVLNLVYYISNGTDGSIAQLGEHLPYKQGVIGSSPIVPTKFFPLQTICGNGSVVERCLAKANVASSNLVSRSIFLLGEIYSPLLLFGAIAKW